MEGQDAVIHAAVRSTLAHGHYRAGEAEPFDVNVRGTFNVFEAAREAGIKRVIFIASAETHVPHPSGELVTGDTPYRASRRIFMTSPSICRKRSARGSPGCTAWT